MSEKIIIDIDDIHEEHPDDDSGKDRIVIDVPPESEQSSPPAKIEIEAIEESYEAKIRQSKTDFYYKGNQGLCNNFETQLRFPEGIDRSFGSHFQMQLNDEFSIMHYEDSGKVYMFQERDGTAHEMFEVTGSMIMAWQSLFECINETEE